MLEFFSKENFPNRSFWDKVQVTPYCWNWLGVKCPEGYGKVTAKNDKNDMIYLAHRLFYHYLKGDLVEGLTIDHLCHNPSCVNPDHLRQITITQNNQNRTDRKRNNTSGYRGVSWDNKRGAWTSSAGSGKTRLRKGGRYYFPSHERHVAAYYARQAREELFTFNTSERLSQV